MNVTKKTVWIDLDNSPHVPFFNPIIKQLEQCGYEVVLTARNAFQTCELADLAGFRYQRIGRHYGKAMVAKVVGLIIRSLQLVPFVWRKKPDIAVSHGSRSQHLTSFLCGLPAVTILDYEHAKLVPLVNFIRVIVPDLIPAEAVPIAAGRITKYPGIKEDVYVPGFVPDPKFPAEIGIGEDRIVILIRPPATEAHYRSPESEALFQNVMDFLGNQKDTLLVILPRTPRQREWIADRWPQFYRGGKIIVPSKAVDGLNLIWWSDLVISGGGTMNREAAALGVPVYSIFRGQTGAVDQYLAETGRLVLIESIADLRAKVNLQRRQRSGELRFKSSQTLDCIVGGIVSALETR